MKRSGIADLPLHGGRVPEWLAESMTLLGVSITQEAGGSSARRQGAFAKTRNRAGYVTLAAISQRPGVEAAEFVRTELADVFETVDIPNDRRISEMARLIPSKPYPIREA